MTTTATRPAELRRMAASVLPRTVDEAARTVELVIATDQPIDALSLVCTREAVEFGPAPVPVLLSHSNHTSQMAGRITELRFERGQVIGTAQFTGAPAADQGWQLARAGCAVSVGARIDPDALRSLNREADQATRWRLLEASLVPVGADPRAVTRSFNQAPEGAMTTANTAAPAAVQITEDQPELTRSALIRQNKILRAANAAGLDTEQTDELVHSNLSADDALVRVFSVVRGRLSQSTAGHPAGCGFATEQRQATALPSSALAAEVLAAKFGHPDADPDLAYVSLARALEPLAAGAGMAVERMSSARILERAYSTSDFSTALLASGERMVLAGYASAPEGVRALAMRRPLADFRAVTGLRVSKYGSLAKKPEGGDYTATTWSEEDAFTLKADEYGRIAILTRKAVINDDLDIFGRLLSEMGASAARLEAELLAERLLNGFTWGSGNSDTATDIADALEKATLKLRRQTDAEGHRVSFNPRVLLVPPELEAQALRVLSDRYMPEASSGVNPFNVTLEVDAQLSAADEIYIADSDHAPLVLGTIGAPVVTTDEVFDNGGRKLRVQHDAAAAVSDQRSIVKVTVTPAVTE
jgi:hypothetical protein